MARRSGPRKFELLSAGSIAGEFPVRRFIGGNGTSAVKVSESSPLGSSVLRLEDAGSADPLPLVALTGLISRQDFSTSKSVI